MRANGTVACWGANVHGQVGDGSTTNRPAPVAVGGLSNAVGVAAGASHSCALLADGTARCWGANDPASSATAAPPAGSCRWP